ncbi:hypothetical protein GX563_00100 [Candidatus Bathyarchaeota archaeon]|nr:hypothetical protein [Candidatus Bathyarchaeota archaeon]
MQVYNLRENPTKYHCCDCGKRLVARAKTPQWRDIPADQKRCRSCSMKHRLELKRIQKAMNSIFTSPVTAPPIPVIR